MESPGTVICLALSRAAVGGSSADAQRGWEYMDTACRCSDAGCVTESVASACRADGDGQVPQECYQPARRGSSDSQPGHTRNRETSLGRGDVASGCRRRQQKGIRRGRRPSREAAAVTIVPVGAATIEVDERESARTGRTCEGCGTDVPRRRRCERPTELPPPFAPCRKPASRCRHVDGAGRWEHGTVSALAWGGEGRATVERRGRGSQTSGVRGTSPGIRCRYRAGSASDRGVSCVNPGNFGALPSWATIRRVFAASRHSRTISASPLRGKPLALSALWRR